VHLRIENRFTAAVEIVKLCLHSKIQNTTNCNTLREADSYEYCTNTVELEASPNYTEGWKVLPTDMPTN